MIELPDNLLDLAGSEKVAFCEDPIITSPEIAVLMIKPSNRTPNANNSLQNIKSIIRRIEAKGWRLHSLKVIAGSTDTIAKIAAHYPQPFYDSSTKDVRHHLTNEERQKLTEIWGEDAANYALYHPVHLSKKGLMDFETAAKTWHKGRGIDNKLLDVGHPEGINSVTTQKDSRYGKRRLFLVRPDADDPFFIVNGFTAEMVGKFSRPEERIVIMVIAQDNPTHSLSYLREHVIGSTNPHEAPPGSIRYDALHAKTYTGDMPITSQDEVGIENNIVHLSESLSEASRELAIWMPELLWYPPQGMFAPDIPYTTWQNLKEKYLHQTLQPKTNKLASPKPDELIKLSTVTHAKSLPKLSVNIMAGGSGGRLFGYELPENERNKLAAPLVRLNNRRYSFLELQLSRLASYEQVVTSINIIASVSSAEVIQQKLTELSLEWPKLAPALERSSVLVRQNVPRIVPLASDLLNEKKFVAYCNEHGLDTNKTAHSVAKKAGELVYDEHTITSKPPGHLSVLLHYIYHRLRDDVANDVEVAYFHIGEDCAAGLNAAFLGHAKASSAVACVSFIKSPVLGQGFLAQNGKQLQVIETADDTTGLSAPFYLHTCRLAFNVKNLASFLAGDQDIMKMNEAQLRARVAKKILSKLIPKLEIKPVGNYKYWAGQFAYTLGQIVEAVPAEFIDDDLSTQRITTFKTTDELESMLPHIQKAYERYL